MLLFSEESPASIHFHELGRDSEDSAETSGHLITTLLKTQKASNIRTTACVKSGKFFPNLFE